jgi:hypothetical protein
MHTYIVHTFVEESKYFNFSPFILIFLTGVQGCQMAYFQTKNSNLGKFWRVLQWKMVVYFMATRSILLPLWSFGIF